MLKVQTIISKETIKPSSPTPPHLNSLELSSLDQTAPQIFTHVLLFYANNATVTSPDQIAFQLKTSLSRVLTYFYPLAGRISLCKKFNILCVECNDEGVEFVEARTDSDLCSFLADPPIEKFSELLPVKVTEFRWVEDPLLAVQLTSFACKGFALGVSVSHLIADGASIALFLNCWSDTARGIGLGSSAPCRFDSASVFPPHSSLSNRPLPDRTLEDRNDGVSIKRFLIDAQSIKRLRTSAYDRTEAPTRVEAVSALVWRCLNRARGETEVPLSHVVNIRRKTSQLSTSMMGYLCLSAVAPGRMSVGQREAEAAIRNAVRKVDEEYVRRREMAGWEHEGEVGWIFSSWCRMNWYRNDFGWGEPVWFGCGIRDMKDVCILIDDKDGDGVEVWLWLEREEMERIERDKEFLDFVSC